jgi:hypothetical protein
MNQNNVRSPGDALVYLIDCTLATVEHMALKKSRSEGEYRRQQAIAQKGIDWALEFHLDLSSTRANEVQKVGNVAAWARQMDVKELA